MAGYTTYLPSICAVLYEAGVPPLVLCSGTMIGHGQVGDEDCRVQVLIPRTLRRKAMSALELLPWRYSWVRSGLMRLMPMAYYWWDGGIHVEVYWESPAAPLPASSLTPLTDELWRSSTPSPLGSRRPDPAALLVYLAVQACRPGRGHGGEWQHFVELRSSINDVTRINALARRVGVSRGVRRALTAYDARMGRPGAGPLFDGVLGVAWRLALGVQARARPQRYRRLLAGVPFLGDTTIRCRIAGVETRAGAGVFVPTPDAEHFVEMAGKRIEGIQRPTIIEVGTGSGAIALALASARSNAVVIGTELSGTAVRCARENARRLGLKRVTFSAGSLLDPVPTELHGHTDVIIANLPFYAASNYAAIGSVPRGTIEGTGGDGLDLFRQLARHARSVLRPGGCLLLQMFAWQWEILAPELAELGYAPGTPKLSGPFAICPAEFGAQRAGLA